MANVELQLIDEHILRCYTTVRDEGQLASGHGACRGVAGIVEGNPFWFTVRVLLRISIMKSSYPVVLVVDQLSWAENELSASLGREVQVFPRDTPPLVVKSAGVDLQNILTYVVVDAGIMNFTLAGADIPAKPTNPKYLIP